MTRFTPSISVPLLLLFIFCATNVLAGPALREDIVYVSENPDNIVNSPIVEGKTTVEYTVDNAELNQVGETPDPNNTVGLLYSPSDACPNSDSKDIPSNIPDALMKQRIALINLSASCSVIEQIYTVQQQGAIGAIIYGDGVTTQSSQKPDLKIPSFRIKKEIGSKLAKELQDYEAEQQTSQGRKMIRVSMVNSSSSFGSGWQIAIIVIGAVLAISFLVSVMIHCRLYQLRRRERSMMIAQHEASVNAKLKVFTLEKSVVKSFPTKVYDKRDIIFSTGSSKSANSSPDLCSICLEEFSDGETLRELPCSHLYHMECVDKWLTTKSSNCPLCKQDTTPPAIAEKREKKHAHAVQIQDRLDNIYGTSNEVESSRFSRFLEWFGYGSSSSREVRSHVRPTGGNLFSIQELPPAHSDRMV